MSTGPQAKHECEPSITITAGREFVESVVAPCRHCGELQTFPVSDAADTNVRRLRPVPDFYIDGEPVEGRSLFEDES